MNVRALHSHIPPVRNPCPEAMQIEAVRKAPVSLTPIPWGKPDPVLGRAICAHIAEVTPPIVIPCNPITEAKTRRTLRSHAIAHD